MNTKELESKGYVASPDDVEEITQGALNASAQARDSRMTYLRVLVGTTQSQLGMPVTKRRGIPPAMDKAEVKRQLEALEEVHARFYEVVLRVVQEAPLHEEERGEDRKLVYARRANFARSSKATLRAWILSENNLKSLVAAKVTKYALQAEIAKRRGPPIRAPSEKRVLSVAERLLQRIRTGTPEQSIRLLEVVLERLVIGLNEMGVETTTRLEEAIRDHKFVKTQTGVVYWPVRGAPPETRAAA